MFEKLNQERLKDCAKTAESARQAIATSKKLTQEATELISQVRAKRRKAS
jgi:hypothetical protein